MTKRRTDARLRKCEKLEDRRMLAADLSSELFSFSDLESSSVEVATSEVNAGDTGQATIDAESMRSKAELYAGTDMVLAWNNLFNELLVADEANQNPGYASRSMAMLNLAIYDAVTLANGDPSDTFYDYDVDSRRTAHVDAEVVATHAAYTVLSSLYPDQQSMIDAFYRSALANLPDNPSTAASLALGTEIGNQILAARANDGSDAVVEYSYTEGIGYFQADPLNPDVPVWGPGWGEVETFVVSSAEDFAPETTPPITSEEYAASYNEVLELGSVDSTVRTADQTEAGIFWAYDRVGLGTPLSLFNDALESIAIGQGNTMEENAALYAQASVAMADAAIVAWHTKFDEEFWRPVTAIHDGDLDGNPLTEGDTEWIALGAPDGGDDVIGFTPQFPTYISGHATFGGALFGAIQEFYGTDDIAFELTSHELEILLENPELQEAYGLDLDDATRSFDSLSEAMAENGRSRVYLGIHFDFDDLVGQEVGQAVAVDVSTEFVVATNDDGGRKNERPGRADRPGDEKGRPGRMGPVAPGPERTGLPRVGSSMEQESVTQTPGTRPDDQPGDSPMDPPVERADREAREKRRIPSDLPNTPLDSPLGDSDSSEDTPPETPPTEAESNSGDRANRPDGRELRRELRRNDATSDPQEQDAPSSPVDEAFTELGDSEVIVPLRGQLLPRGDQRRGRG